MNEDLSGLTLIQLLARLELAPEPAAISLWPQADGWLWFGIFLMLLFGGAAYRFIVWRRANAYRRVAEREIVCAGGDTATIAAILRRTALVAYPRSAVAALHGDDWLAFLDKTYGGTKFSSGPARMIATAPYRKCLPDQELSETALAWVRGHGRQPI